MFKVGIFFGGPAREREISFLGGKTTYTGLDRYLFEPIPVFIDGRGNFILIDPAYMESASIRDFYPPQAFVSSDKYPFRVYEESLSLSPDQEEAMIASVGKRLLPHEFRAYFDFAFLAVHGPQLEDGAIQGLLEWYGIPYYGSGLMGSGIGIDKIAQNELIQRTVGLPKRLFSLSKSEWDRFDKEVLFEQVKARVGLPFVCKAPHQGSSIGVSFVKTDDIKAFEAGVLQSFFQKTITPQEWVTLSYEEKGALLQQITNLDEGIAFPLFINEEKLCKHPAELWEELDTRFAEQYEPVQLSSIHSEDAVLFESFVKGQEFSCGVIQDFDGKPLALPPSEVIKDDEDIVFDFKTKYLTSVVRKGIPIRTSLENNEKVHAYVKETFRLFAFGACARIDGFLSPEGEVLLHDPNTLPGMSPSSFIFKQMAEIGLNVTDSLTYFIRFSLRERIRTGKFTGIYRKELAKLDALIKDRTAHLASRPTKLIAFEATDESYEIAKKLYNVLTASAEWRPLLVYKHPALGEVVINAAYMAKPGIVDLNASLTEPLHPLIAACRENALEVTRFITGDSVPEVIAYQ
ncbi:D-alanine--D-alanine ligase [Siphonobacter sp. SORGH_AS_0500]|uniref:D-alanine--D-alanine ligase family protein n=1 Tax=Siphonobacter sp. SORGH_AS_0500 TaxID=1864824 RepID=UPI0028677896|nr:D-alanine--D-alanine ligase [Siphonobacter sp. SORGH_AS_0500]MDR6197064.1 D-alanine-D-alanine ligase [Siphonobacter sp. SORGH_AS_0500]